MFAAHAPQYTAQLPKRDVATAWTCLGGSSSLPAGPTLELRTVAGKPIYMKVRTRAFKPVLLSKE